jgi:hypothetical protein
VGPKAAGAATTGILVAAEFIGNPRSQNRDLGHPAMA